MTERLQALANALPEELDAALITAPQSRRYYTGFQSSAGTLLVSRRGCALIIDSRYHEAASRAVEGCEVLLQEKLYEQIAGALKRFGAQRAAVENARMTLRDFDRLAERLEGVELVDDDRLSDLILEQRQIKDAAEIACIRQSQELADRSFAHILEYIREGRTEREVALELEFYARSIGSHGNAFPVIAVSGVNSSMPHGVPGDKKLESGDLLTMDFGCVVDGYCSDMTRTVAIGSVGERQREVYDTVLRAQKAALDRMRPGTSCREVDAAARDLIDASPFAGSFGHGLGHSLGLEVHESPSCNTVSEAVLRPGMLMTAEPGIYLAGEFGVRIEDLVVITADGHDNLTGSPKELFVL